MRILVCGGRFFAHRARLFAFLDRFVVERGPVSMLVHGGAKGADELAACWACTRGVASIQVTADWKKHGKAAGPIRNQRMLHEHTPDVVVAFPGGRGTESMVRLAKAAGIEVVEVHANGEDPP